MGHGKETPRQKMIGLMYLFLTALMAMNVSKEVLNAFINVGESLEKTIHNYEAKNEKLYAEFAKQNQINPDKVGPWLEKALKVREKADHLFQLLEKHKLDLAIYAEGPEAPCVADGHFHIELLAQKDNIDLGGSYFGELGLKHGVAIQKEINEYQHLLEEVVHDAPEELKENIHKVLETHGHIDHEGLEHSWVSHTFEHHPLIACFVQLSKLQTDVKNMETDVANYLFAQITAGDFKVNAMAATVIPNSSYIVRGNEYKAEVFLAAYDSTQAPRILVGNYKQTEDGKYEMTGSFDSLSVEGGKGIYTVKPNSIGNKKWGGLIQIKSPTGDWTQYPFDVEYQVAEPSLVVSPTKMNVFYAGIENPVAISVPGIPESDIRPRITNGATIKPNSEGYIVVPTKRSGTVSVQVYADIDGQQKSMGAMEFRIKTVPSPIAKVMGQSSGTISKAMLSNAPSVYAELEDFVFDLKFTITKFTLVAQDGIYTREYNSTSGAFTREQKAAIKSAKRGSRITIENIEARGPDGTDKPLSPIVFKLK